MAPRLGRGWSSRGENETLEEMLEAVTLRGPGECILEQRIVGSRKSVQWKFG